MRLVDNIFNSMLGKSESSPYTYYDYLESDGKGQYIDTGLPANDNTEIHTSIQITSPKVQSFFGVVWSGKGVTINQVTNSRVDLNFSYSIGAVSWDFAGWNDVKFGRTTEITHGGTTHTYNFNPTTFNTGFSIYLFAQNRGGLVRENAMCRLTEMRIYDNGVLVQYFRPAVRIADGVAGMHDVLNDVFYTNANPAGDNFLYGNLT